MYQSNGLYDNKNYESIDLGEFGELNKKYNAKLNYELFNSEGFKIKSGEIPFKIYRGENCENLSNKEILG
jgi:hypothetical protein